jgi:sugar phosphate isomerase/epimerase
MTQLDNPTLFPEWLRKAVELGYSPIELARLLGTTPATVAQLIRSVPTRPAEVRKLARQLGIDYESFRTFADNALQPITGFDRDTQRLLRLWERLDAPRREALLTVLGDMARGRAAKRPSRRKSAARRRPA